MADNTLINRLCDTRFLHQTQSFEAVAHLAEEAAAELARLRAQRDKLIVALSAAESCGHDAIEALAASESKRATLAAECLAFREGHSNTNRCRCRWCVAINTARTATDAANALEDQR